jgi:hypothetical protein
MLTADDMLALRSAHPFTPFRLHLAEGDPVEVPSREMLLPGRDFAVVGILNPNRSETLADGWVTVWYAQVTRIEMLTPDSTFPSAA